MIITLLLGLLLLTAGVTLLARAVAVPRMMAERTLRNIDEYGYAAGRPTLEGGSDTIIEPLDAFASFIGGWVGSRIPLTREAELRKLLLAAGMYRVDPRKVMGYQSLAAAGFALLWLWSATARGTSGVTVFLGLLICAAGGWYMPYMLIRRRARQRLDRIEYDLPELIDLLVVAVEAGLGFSAAMRVASERLRGPLGDEVRLTLQEQALGLSTNEALKALLVRADTASMRSFVRAMIQGEQLGISIGQILRNIAEEMRKRRRAAAEERAQKAPIKMLFPLVFLMFPAIFVILLGPAVFAFLDALG